MHIDLALKMQWRCLVETLTVFYLALRRTSPTLPSTDSHITLPEVFHTLSRTALIRVGTLMLRSTTVDV